MKSDGGSALLADDIPDRVLESILTASNFSVQQVFLPVIEGRLAGQKDEEDNATGPQVHGRAIRPPLRALHLHHRAILYIRLQ
jgi:hypothetical protein